MEESNVWNHYALIDPRIDDPVMQVRYVGRTKRSLGDRYRSHLQEARSGGVNYKCRWIRKLLREGVRPKYVSLGQGNADFESELILVYKEHGTVLTNSLGGSEGWSGPSEEYATIQRERAEQRLPDGAQSCEEYLILRVAEKFEITDGGCFIWTGKLDKNGCPITTLKGKDGSVQKHIYEVLVGSIPEGMVVYRLCKNKLCINPDCLEVGTNADVQRLHHPSKPKPRREKPLFHQTKSRGCSRKLTDEQVIGIMARLLMDAESQRGIAQSVNVCRKTVRSIWDGSSYLHLFGYDLCNNSEDVEKLKNSWKTKEEKPKKEKKAPLTKEERQEFRRSVYARPEVQAKMSESQKINQNRPETRAKVAAAREKYNSDPEYLSRVGESLRRVVARKEGLTWEEYQERERKILELTQQGWKRGEIVKVTGATKKQVERVMKRQM